MKLQLVFTVAALACGAAYAQDQAPAAATAATDDPVSSIFSQLDTDKDGMISSEEAQASSVVSRSFAKADANGDGKITRDEFMAAFTAQKPSSPGQTPPPAVPPQNPQ